jgi:hypothetical protein
MRAILHHWRRSIVWLRFGAALFAFGVGAFWLMSAWGELPQMITYLGYTPADDPFFQALAHSAKMNRLAAWLACISAVLAGAAEITAAWSAGSPMRRDE